ncbi:hypothetical protein QTO34_018512 [Cnephaeus nilssonii]|uniref:Uncharacterized protein n=1 Tax=Cnephaeus nilssonii TaxID=3371016 RepID=A0AA40HYY3_CNENI|nr:hypothetical protein QTO34_018512 [Eptesicus nilssonii]
MCPWIRVRLDPGSGGSRAHLGPGEATHPLGPASCACASERPLQNVVITIHFVTVGRSAVVQGEDGLTSKGFGPEAQSSAACTSHTCLHGHIDWWGRSRAAFVGGAASPRLRGVRPHPGPGPRAPGRVASPGPGIQPHPDPGARGLTRTQGCTASPGPGGVQPHPGPGSSLTWTQGRAASPGPGGVEQTLYKGASLVIERTLEMKSGRCWATCTQTCFLPKRCLGAFRLRDRRWPRGGAREALRVPGLGNARRASREKKKVPLAEISVGFLLQIFTTLLAVFIDDLVKRFKGNPAGVQEQNYFSGNEDNPVLTTYSPCPVYKQKSYTCKETRKQLPHGNDSVDRN